MATTTANVKATRTAITANYPFSSAMLLSDPMHDNSKNAKWDTSSFCTFTGTGYLASTAQKNTYQPCFASGTATLSNFVYEVDMTIQQGDCGGIIFRADSTGINFYYFLVCQGGFYILYSMGKDAANTQTLIDFSPSGFPVNLNQTTQIAVRAKGNEITLYMEQIALGSVKNT